MAAATAKTLGRFPTKTAAWNAAQMFRVQPSQPKPSSVPTVATLVEHYRAERMPSGKILVERISRGFASTFCRSGGKVPITDIQARPVGCGWIRSILHPRAVLTFAGFSAHYGMSQCGNRPYRCKLIQSLWS